MHYQDIVEFYEKLKRERVSRKNIEKRLTRKFKLKFVGDGAYSRVFSKKGFGFVAKFCRGNFLPEASTRTLKRAFVGYVYLSKDKKFGIQRKLKIKNYKEKYFDKVRFCSKDSLFPIEKKFRALYPRVYNFYDIHYQNLGEYKGKVFLIDF